MSKVILPNGLVYIPIDKQGISEWKTEDFTLDNLMKIQFSVTPSEAEQWEKSQQGVAGHSLGEHFSNEMGGALSKRANIVLLNID